MVEETESNTLEMDLKMKLKLAEVEKRKQAREETLLKVKISSVSGVKIMVRKPIFLPPHYEPIFTPRIFSPLYFHPFLHMFTLLL
jgi:hypothetical protein